MRKILCLSSSNYYPFPTRKQNIMNRLTDCDIIYVNPAVSCIAPLKDKSADVRAYKKPPVKAMPHIWVYDQPPVLPFYSRHRSINAFNQKRLARYLAAIIKKHGFGDDFWIWAYLPSVCDLIDPLARETGINPDRLEQRVIYDCVDRHSAYPGLIDPLLVDRMEQELAQRAFTVFATAQGLYDRLRAFNGRCFLVANGCNYELFSRAAFIPKKDPKTVFGFVGMLQECIDYSCIEAVAKEFPSAEIRLIGRRLPGVDTGRLERYENIEFVGLLPQEELPERISDFDVCLNIFSDGELSRDVSPLKFYEYLATGKPIVSTPVPLQVNDYENCVYIAKDADGFVSACRLALSEPSEDRKRELRLEAARSCSWDERVKQLRRHLNWDKC